MSKEIQNIERLIKVFMANPMTAKHKKVVLKNGQGEDVIFEVTKKTTLNQAGMPETEVINQSIILDDGTSTSGVSHCQKCNGLVSTKSLHRCPCGKTVCLRPRCGKVYGEKWFCSLRHVFLYKLKLLRRF